MKRKLTSDITRYDSNIRVRFNFETLKAVLLSLMLGAGMLMLLMHLSLAVAITVALCSALLVFLIMITRVDGLPLYAYLIHCIATLLRPESRVKHYENYMNEITEGGNNDEDEQSKIKKKK